jgi:hypothetical protein
MFVATLVARCETPSLLRGDTVRRSRLLAESAEDSVLSCLPLFKPTFRDFGDPTNAVGAVADVTSDVLASSKQAGSSGGNDSGDLGNMPLTAPTLKPIVGACVLIALCAIDKFDEVTSGDSISNALCRRDRLFASPAFIKEGRFDQSLHLAPIQRIPLQTKKIKLNSYPIQGLLSRSQDIFGRRYLEI